MRWRILALVLVVVGLLAFALRPSGDVDAQIGALLDRYRLHPVGSMMEQTGNLDSWRYVEPSATDASRAIGLQPPKDVSSSLSMRLVELEERWSGPGKPDRPRGVTAYFLVVDEEVVGAWLTVDGLEGGVVPLNSPDLIRTGVAWPGT